MVFPSWIASANQCGNSTPKTHLLRIARIVADSQCVEKQSWWSSSSASILISSACECTAHVYVSVFDLICVKKQQINSLHVAQIACFFSFAFDSWLQICVQCTLWWWWRWPLKYSLSKLSIYSDLISYINVCAQYTYIIKRKTARMSKWNAFAKRLQLIYFVCDAMQIK